LRTIELEEQFGGKTYQNQKSKDDKKKSEIKGKAAIGFVYEDSTAPKAEEVAPPVAGQIWDCDVFYFTNRAPMIFLTKGPCILSFCLIDSYLMVKVAY
jgi:hypothetical protein